MNDFYFKKDEYELNITSKVDEMYGSRIATWMFYVIGFRSVFEFVFILVLNNPFVFSKLESPQLGGSTVFPALGLQVKPVDRSAVFWYNLLPDTKPDERMIHAACPVILGSKWVSNKWIRSKGQVFYKPCPPKKLIKHN